MKNATKTHLSRLVKVFGTFSTVARYLGFTPRWMRHIRAEVISPQSALKIRIAGSNLQLRSLLRELRRTGVVTPAHLQQAWGNIRAQEAGAAQGNHDIHPEPLATTVTKSA